MQKLLKAQYIMNKMHEYEIKSYFLNKHLNSTQIFQKQDFQPIVLKSQTLNIFCIKIKEFSILDGQKQDHTQYNVPSLAKSNLCSVCN